MIRRTKPEVERYVASVQAAASSPREKSLKGFLFAKLYFEIKEYELAKRYISAYLSVQERDPKAHRFLGQIYEAQDNIEKAFGCYKRSVELNPMQKDLVLKIVELLCNNDITDGRAKYWVEKAARLFPGNPAAYRLKEQLLERNGEDGWNQLLDMIQAELYARPDDTYLNIRLVALYRSSHRLRDAVLHCQEAEKKIPVESSLEWCSCVIKTYEEYLESVQDLESDKTNWRTVKRDHLLAYSSFVKMMLASRDVRECREALESFDRVLHSVKPYVNGADELSRAFLEMKGHLYMHAGTFLLKMAQNNETRWRDACELAALCYLKSFSIPKPKSKLIKGDPTGQDMLEMLACDRKSQSGHMLLNLSHGKEDFLKEIVESFANKSGLITLFESLFGSEACRERSFLGTDDTGNVSPQPPVQGELSKYDIGAVRVHNGSLQHLVWLGLQWNSMSALHPVRKLLKQLFHLPQETSRLESDAPESICLLDLEVFLLGAIFTSSLQLQEKFSTRYDAHQPRFLPLLLCKQYCTEKQRSWWDAVRALLQKRTTPDSATKLKLLVQHGLSTLRALEKHGLQPALMIHWARNLQKTGMSLNSFYDQKEYIGRSVYYWRKILLSLKTVKKDKSIPEPTDPLFRHFHNLDIQVFQVAAYEEEARIAFATLDAVEGKTDEALLAFEAIKNVVSYWNLAILCQRKAEEIENDDMLPEEQEEHRTYLLKRRHYLLKIIDESSSDPSVADKLPVSIETVTEMLNTVIQELGENDEEEGLASGNMSQAADLEVKRSVPSAKKLSSSPTNSYKFSPKTVPQWAEDHKSLLQMLCQQVEALKNEMQEMKLTLELLRASSHRWPAESYRTDTMSDSYQRAQSLPEAPLTVATTGPSVYCSQPPAYNSQYLLRTAATDVTPTKAPAPGIISPRGGDDSYNSGVPQANTNRPLPEPGYFTKPSVAPATLKPAESKGVEFSRDKCVQPGTAEGSKAPQPTTFQGSTHGGDEDDDGPQFDPVVPLPDKIEAKTGEEDEEEFFCNRAKLFRFDAESKQWKERGVGNVKILKHKASGKFRLLMRRDQVLKICANHYINSDMKLAPSAGSDRSFVWHALDHADELPKPEQLAIRFKTAEEAVLFKRKFEECQNALKTAGSSAATSVTQSTGTAKEVAHRDLKESSGSTVRILNSAFRFSKDSVTSESESKGSFPSTSTAPTTFSFGKEAVQTSSSGGGFGQSPLNRNQWELGQRPSPDPWEARGIPLTESAASLKGSGNTAQGKFGSAFAKKEGQWDCNICLVRNEPTATKRVAGQNPSKTSAEVTPEQFSFKLDRLDTPKAAQNDVGTAFPLKATGSPFGFSFNPPRKSGDGTSPLRRAELQNRVAEAPKSSGAPQKLSDSKASNLAPSARAGPCNFSFKILDRAEKTTEPSDSPSSDDVVIVYELTPTPEQRALAGFLKLPSTFFCYKNKPGCVSEEDDDEDYETAVKKLNGKLYPTDEKEKRKWQGTLEKKELESECITTSETKPPEEKAEEEVLLVPSPSACGGRSNAESDSPEGSQAEVKTQLPEEGEVTDSTDVVPPSKEELHTPSTSAAAVVFVQSAASSEQPDSTGTAHEPQNFSGADDKPVDLSTKKEGDPECSGSTEEHKPMSFGFGNASGLSFADLASKSSGDFAFGSKDKNFKWANTGAAVFGVQPASKAEEDEGGSDDEVVHSDDIHFEPIVSLPEEGAYC